jgi:hypothetical protein
MNLDRVNNSIEHPIVIAILTTGSSDQIQRLGSESNVLYLIGMFVTIPIWPPALPEHRLALL